MHRAIEGLRCTTAVHICYGYGIEANVEWKKTLGQSWRQYEQVFPALAASRTDRPAACRAAADHKMAKRAEQVFMGRERFRARVSARTIPDNAKS